MNIDFVGAYGDLRETPHLLPREPATYALDGHRLQADPRVPALQRLHHGLEGHTPPQEVLLRYSQSAVVKIGGRGEVEEVRE